MAARLLALPGLMPRLPNAAAFATRYRVLLLADAAGTPIDISFGALPLEESALRRAESISGLPVATIEDRLLQLLWRARPGDWERIRSLARQHRATLQWPYLDFWAPELAAAKDDSQMLDAYQAARQQALNSH